MNLDGRVALITGGRRIGAVVATELARGGADVALVYNRSKSEAEETARTIEAVGQRAIILPADLSDPTACQQIVDGTVDRFGRLDVLVNMASVYRSVPFDDITVDIWETQLNVDLRAAWLCARAAAPHMRRLRGGRIINFSDWLTRSGRPRYEGYLTYYVAKAGVAALTEAMALELAKDQILVNAIAPGPTDTEALRAQVPQDYIKSMLAQMPLARLGTPQDLLKALVFLLSEDAAWVTGLVMNVDGGQWMRA